MTLNTKHFFMIRHGETISNVQGWVAGSIDAPLTRRGENEATLIKHYLETISNKPNLMVYSTLSRSKNTTIILNEALKLPMLECASMAERCFGDWQGLPLEVMREYRDSGVEPPNGETTVEFTRRVTRGLEEVLEVAELPLIVTHGAVFGSLFRAFGCKSEVVKNCHLYEFVPNNNVTSFPWKVLSHDIREDGTSMQNPVEITDVPCRPIGRSSQGWAKKAMVS